MSTGVPGAGWQREDQFSDGTLRLIGLFWALLEGDSPLLLEEPELSLNSAIIRKLPALIFRLQRQKKRPGPDQYAQLRPSLGERDWRRGGLLLIPKPGRHDRSIGVFGLQGARLAGRGAEAPPMPPYR